LQCRRHFMSSPGGQRSLNGIGQNRTSGSHTSTEKPLLLRLPPYIWYTAGGTTIFIGYCYYSYLDEVPYTKRKRLIATTPSGEKRLGDNEYKKLILHFSKDILPSDHRASITLQRVGKRITEASYQFSKQYDPKAASLPQIPYTYTVIRSDMANAFVLPGNHVFLMTGLLKYVRDEDELAIVIGHEMAHNIARHAGEKVSGSFIVNILAGLSLLFDPSGSLLTILLPSAALFRELPNSRIQEIEADEIGMRIAVEACYDPRAAKRVFGSMAHEHYDDNNNNDGGSPHNHRLSPPELLSTHPAYDTRLSNFDKWIPKAMERYESDNGERCRGIREHMKLARQIAANKAVLKEMSKR
jgi:metalloendopeptidase OMA1, mitochondrial